MPGTQGTDGRAATPSPSTADDLAELIALLEEQNREGSTWPLGVDALTLQEDSARLPGLWPRLFELLGAAGVAITEDRKSTRLNSSHVAISYAVFCLSKNSYIIHSMCLSQILHIRSEINS